MNKDKKSKVQRNQEVIESVFANTFEWLRGVKEYTEWTIEHYYDENGNFIQDADHDLPMKYKKYSSYGSMYCGLAAALFADDQNVAENAAKAILSITCSEFTWKDREDR
jgi:hypothetical protein